MVFKDSIRKNYSKVALKKVKSGCCSGGCGCSSDVKKASLQIGYTEMDISDIPEDSNMGLGCGNPVALASLREGETVLDLGSGGGFDCFLARKRVGEKGYVIGVDITEEMVALANKNKEKSGYKNMDFRTGDIEHLPVEDGIVDVIISNCVINLSPDKEKVFKEAFRVLKRGGRLLISDVVAVSDIPDDIKADEKMYCGCVSGAVKIEDLKALIEKAGFSDIKMFMKDNSKEIISSWSDNKNLEEIVASYYIEALKK